MKLSILKANVIANFFYLKNESLKLFMQVSFRCYNRKRLITNSLKSMLEKNFLIFKYLTKDFL